MLIDNVMTNLFISNSTNQEDIRFASQVVGYIGGVLVVAYNLPQLIKMIRTKSTDDVSMLSLVMQFVLNLIYIAYSILIGELPMLSSECIAAIICISMMVLKRIYDKPKVVKDYENNR